MVRMIAVWGSPGSGKGVLSIALAAQLAALHKNTVIISSNSSVPALPCYLPNEHLGPDESLGGLIFSPMQNINALKGYIHIHPDSERIGVMGLASGDSPLTYKGFRRENMLTLLRLLDGSPFDYVIFDCQENPTRDSMTVLALETSEYVLRMITPDVRGIEFEKAQLLWMSGAADMRVDRQIRAIAPIYPFPRWRM